MKTAMTTTVSRRAWLSRLLLAAAVAPVVGVRLADTADASKKTKKQIKQAAEAYRRGCEAGGGTATVTQRPGGTTVACTGSEAGDWTCTVSSKNERCHANLPNPPKTPLDDVNSPPIHGVNEEPTDGGGGNNAGGGAHVPPSDWVDVVNEEPTDGGGSDPVLE